MYILHHIGYSDRLSLMQDSNIRNMLALGHDGPIKMYVCGPTVYSHTHLGHMKTYVSFDIIRRIIEDHFKMPTQFMINITNIDDKIIKNTYEEKYGKCDLSMLDPGKFLQESEFRAFAHKWEKSFFDVMDKLNVKRPNIVSRVTEYIPEILKFVEKIEDKGFAFEDSGSVYFHGTKYHKTDDENKDPSNPHNFVLLKKKKSYEPGWDSKWGKVRPGWHIECSVMASAVFGDSIDIHGGGIDLKFPHHQNEELQSKVHHFATSKGIDKNKKWVQRFMHTGHLNIDGLKMSKSLKNFITASEALEKYSPDQIRMLFLTHQWNDPMNYSEESMATSNVLFEGFINFRKQITSALIMLSSDGCNKMLKEDIELSNILGQTKINVNNALSYSFDTPKSIKLLQKLCSDTYIYLHNSKNPIEQLLKDILGYVETTLSMFGLQLDSATSDLLINRNTKYDELIKTIAHYRTNLRTEAIDVIKKVKKIDKTLATELGKNLFTLTDNIRDHIKENFDVDLVDT